MKNTLLLKTLLLSPALLAGINANAQSSEVSEMYIVPVSAEDGTLEYDGDDLANKIPMTENADGTFSAKGCDIQYGFVFLGNSDTHGTLYTVSYWAVNPPVEIGPNPLEITTASAKQYIKTPAGKYDITFTPAEVAQVGSRLFDIKPSESEARFPDKIFLTSGTEADKNIELTGTDGVYTTIIRSDTGNFSISYEPSNKYSVFLYGSKDASSIASGEKIPINLGTDTESAFSLTPAEGKEYHLTVSLVPDDMYVTAVESLYTSVDIIPTSSEISKYYDISGKYICSSSDIPSTLPSGIYIAVQGTKAHKVMITH